MPAAGAHAVQLPRGRLPAPGSHGPPLPPHRGGLDEIYPFPVMSLRHIAWAGWTAPHCLLAADASELSDCGPAPASAVSRPGFGAQLGAAASAQRTWAAQPGSLGLLRLLRQRARALTSTPLALEELSQRPPNSQKPPRIQQQSQSPSVWRGLLEHCDAAERNHTAAGAAAAAVPPPVLGQPHGERGLGSVPTATLMGAGGDTQLNVGC